MTTFRNSHSVISLACTVVRHELIIIITQAHSKRTSHWRRRSYRRQCSTGRRRNLCCPQDLQPKHSLSAACQLLPLSAMTHALCTQAKSCSSAGSRCSRASKHRC